MMLSCSASVRLLIATIFHLRQQLTQFISIFPSATGGNFPLKTCRALSPRTCSEILVVQIGYKALILRDIFVLYFFKSKKLIPVSVSMEYDFYRSPVIIIGQVISVVWRIINFSLCQQSFHFVNPSSISPLLLPQIVTSPAPGKRRSVHIPLPLRFQSGTPKSRLHHSFLRYLQTWYFVFSKSCACP